METIEDDIRIGNVSVLLSELSLAIGNTRFIGSKKLAAIEDMANALQSVIEIEAVDGIVAELDAHKPPLNQTPFRSCPICGEEATIRLRGVMKCGNSHTFRESEAVRFN